MKGNWIRAIKLALGSNLRPSREPDRQMSTCRMAKRYHPVQIKIVFSREFPEIVCRRCHVQERAWPAAAWIADAPILDVPSRPAGVIQSRTHRSDVVESILRSPEAAVDHDGNWVRPRFCGQLQIAELKLVCAVMHARTFRIADLMIARLTPAT